MPESRTLHCLAAVVIAITVGIGCSRRTGPTGQTPTVQTPKDAPPADRETLAAAGPGAGASVRPPSVRRDDSLEYIGPQLYYSGGDVLGRAAQACKATWYLKREGGMLYIDGDPHRPLLWLGKVAFLIEGYQKMSRSSISQAKAALKSALKGPGKPYLVDAAGKTIRAGDKLDECLDGFAYEFTAPTAKEPVVLVLPWGKIELVEPPKKER